MENRTENVNLTRARGDGLSGDHLVGLVSGVGESVGVGAGLDDGAAEGESVDDRGAEAGVGEGICPAGE